MRTFIIIVALIALVCSLIACGPIGWAMLAFLVLYGAA